MTSSSESRPQADRRDAGATTAVEPAAIPADHTPETKDGPLTGGRPPGAQERSRTASAPSEAGDQGKIRDPHLTDDQSMEARDAAWETFFQETISRPRPPTKPELAKKLAVQVKQLRVIKVDWDDIIAAIVRIYGPEYTYTKATLKAYASKFAGKRNRKLSKDQASERARRAAATRARQRADRAAAAHAVPAVADDAANPEATGAASPLAEAAPPTQSAAERDDASDNAQAPIPNIPSADDDSTPQTEDDAGTALDTDATDGATVTDRGNDDAVTPATTVIAAAAKKREPAPAAGSATGGGVGAKGFKTFKGSAARTPPVVPDHAATAGAPPAPAAP